MGKFVKVLVTVLVLTGGLWAQNKNVISAKYSIPLSGGIDIGIPFFGVALEYGKITPQNNWITSEINGGFGEAAHFGGGLTLGKYIEVGNKSMSS
jgi:hypothetical protein